MTLFQWFDIEACIQKTVNFINAAGQAGCKLVAFPEVGKYLHGALSYLPTK